MTNNQKQIAKIFITVIGHGLLVAVPLLMHAYTFSRDLKLGDSGEDVRALQISLNADAQTRVAVSGGGSPGYETTFFGEKTQSAVIRYQNLHAGEILKPIGLVAGTGFVGAATRNSLSGAVVTGDTTKKSFSEAVAAFDVAIGAVTTETNRSPVDDPRIPKTQDELVAAVDDFVGPDATQAEIADFSKQMVLARYGYPTNLKSAASGDDDDDETVPRPQCSDGVNNDPSEDTAVDYPNDRGCTSSQDSTERSGSSGGSGGGSREDADVDTTGAGCIGLLLGFLGL